MNSTRRKLAIATWGPPDEGNIFGKLTIDATEAVAWIQHIRTTTGEKVSMTHLVGKAVALALAKAPGLNGRIVWGRYEPFATVDVTFLVALEDGADLAKVKIERLDQRPVTEVARVLRDKADKLRGGKDPEFEKSKGMLRALPTWILRPLLRFTGWLTGSLGVSLPALGLEAFPFGSCIITSVGMLGIEEAFAPHTPFARVPVLILVGAVHDAPAVKNGQLVVQKQVTITATVDHRFVDGSQLGTLAKTVRAVLEDPWTLDGSQRPPAQTVGAA
jgi:pyruvate/2-oxoglutarate dehydrogenase complex dihydrolipoamide acyltransferase (E2) component